MASNESILKTLQELMEKLNVQQEEISTLKSLLQTNGPRSSSLPGDPGSEGGATDSAPSQHGIRANLVEEFKIVLYRQEPTKAVFKLEKPSD